MGGIEATTRTTSRAFLGRRSSRPRPFAVSTPPTVAGGRGCHPEDPDLPRQSGGQIIDTVVRCALLDRLNESRCSLEVLERLLGRIAGRTQSDPWDRGPAVRYRHCRPTDPRLRAICRCPKVPPVRCGFRPPHSTRRVQPDVLLVCSWDVRAYRHVARRWRGRAIRIVYMDNQWLGSPRQYASLLVSPFFLWPCFNEQAFVVGERRAGASLGSWVSPRAGLRAAESLETLGYSMANPRARVSLRRPGRSRESHRRSRRCVPPVQDRSLRCMVTECLRRGTR